MELMVGIAISLILLAGVITVVVRISVASSENIQTVRLNQQLRSAMDFMSKDIQRAGFVKSWPDDIDTVLDLDFDAIATFGSVVVSETGDCILYSYDLNSDGEQGTGAGGANYELFGFRHNAATGAVEMKVSGTHDCESTGWVALTDATVNVTALEFSLIYSDEAADGRDATLYRLTKGASCSGGAQADTCKELGGYRVELVNPADYSSFADACTPEAGDVTCLGRRKIEIALTGELTGVEGVFMELRNHVHLKNDHLQALLVP